MLLYSTVLALLSGQGIILLGENESDEETAVKTESKDEKGQFFNPFHANFALTSRLLQDLNGHWFR